MEVTTSGSDAGQITPLDDQIHDRHGVYPKEALADGGFVNLEDIEAAQAPPRGTRVYAPVPEPKDPERDRYAPLPGDGEQVREWRARMGTEAAKAIYRQRASTVECVNAQARNRGLMRLLVRGLRKVQGGGVVVRHRPQPGLRDEAARSGRPGGLNEGRRGRQESEPGSAGRATGRRAQADRPASLSVPRPAAASSLPLRSTRQDLNRLMKGDEVVTP